MARTRVKHGTGRGERLKPLQSALGIYVGDSDTVFIAFLVPRHLVDEVASRRVTIGAPGRVTPVGHTTAGIDRSRRIATFSSSVARNRAVGWASTKSRVMSLRMTASHSAGRRLRLSSWPIVAQSGRGVQMEDVALSSIPQDADMLAGHCVGQEIVRPLGHVDCAGGFRDRLNRGGVERQDHHRHPVRVHQREAPFVQVQQPAAQLWPVVQRHERARILQCIGGREVLFQANFPNHGCEVYSAAVGTMPLPGVGSRT